MLKIKKINHGKPFAYPCIVTLVAFDIVVTFEISGTLNINGRSTMKNAYVCLSKINNAFYINWHIELSNSISNKK